MHNFTLAILLAFLWIMISYKLFDLYLTNQKGTKLIPQLIVAVPLTPLFALVELSPDAPEGIVINGTFVYVMITTILTNITESSTLLSLQLHLQDQFIEVSQENILVIINFTLEHAEDFRGVLNPTRLAFITSWVQSLNFVEVLPPFSPFTFIWAHFTIIFYIITAMTVSYGILYWVYHKIYKVLPMENDPDSDKVHSSFEYALSFMESTVILSMITVVLILMIYIKTRKNITSKK